MGLVCVLLFGERVDCLVVEEKFGLWEIGVELLEVVGMGVGTV